jgi:hypothetical protein
MATFLVAFGGAMTGGLTVVAYCRWFLTCTIEIQAPPETIAAVEPAPVPRRINHTSHIRPRHPKDMS